MSRGRFLKARFGVNGSQRAARSFGTSARATELGLATVVMRAPRGRLPLPDDGSHVFFCPVVVLFGSFLVLDASAGRTLP